MKKNKNILIGSGIAAVGVLAVTPSITKYLMKIALDRESPKGVKKSRERIKLSDAMLDFRNKKEIASNILENRKCEQVEITSHDGVHLIGHWRTCENAERIIIAMHGWRSSWSRDFGLIADFWHDSGCSVLFAEQRGQNNSGGEYMGFGMLEQYDCLDWINWINEQKGSGLPIYLAGISMGAATVLMTAGLELPANIHGIISDCAFTSPYAIWKYVVENNLYMPYRMHEKVANDLCKKKISYGAKDYSTVNAMKRCKVPILFIHGTDDNFVPIEMTYENYKACAAPKCLFVVPGAEHAMSYYTDKDGYEKAVKAFWDDYDLKAE